MTMHTIVRVFTRPRLSAVLSGCCLLAAAATAAAGSGAAAVPLKAGDGCFRPGAVWLDEAGNAINAHGGGFLFHGGRYYWFGEHKTGGRSGWMANVGIHCYSSENLYRWRDEGLALKVSEDPASPLAKGKWIFERPKVIFCRKTGKFVMWFHYDRRGYGLARSGLAVADAPAGPYRFIGCRRINAGFWPKNVPEAGRAPLTPELADAFRRAHFPGNYAKRLDRLFDAAFRRDFEKGQMARDMTLFVDDDGSAYHIFASEENSALHIARLTDDYLGHTGEWIRIFPKEFNEAPAMFKKGGKYFLITSGCTGAAPNAARLAVADSPMGEWKKLGNPCRGTEEQKRLTFRSQGTYVLPVNGKPGTFIFMADRWDNPNPVDSRYVWLPVSFDEKGVPFLEWRDEWRYGEEGGK